jgi:O-antigen/teichoic acid export membrane protein
VAEGRKKSSLTEQGVWLMAARIIGFVLSTALPLFLVRRLSQEEFGLYKQAFLVIVFAAAILPLGFQMSAYYFLPRETTRRPEIIFNILLFNLFVGGLAFLTLWLAPGLFGSLFQSETLVRLAPAIGAVIFFWIFSTFLEIVAVANQEPRFSTAFIILAQLTKTSLLVAAGAIFGTVESLVYAALVQTVVQTIFLLIYLNLRFPDFWFAFNPRTFWEQAVYALPLGFAGLLWSFQLDLHNFFVSNRFTPAEFAIYATGCFQLPLIGMLSEAVTSVMIPRMSELESADKRREMLALSAIASERLAVFYLPIYVFLMITADVFITTLFTSAYAASVPIFQINLTLLPFYIFLLDPIQRAYKDLGQMLLKLRIVLFIAMTTALWFGVQYLDLRGMIAIVVGVTLIERVLMTVAVGRRLGFQLSDVRLFTNVGKIALACLAAGIPTFAAWWLAHNAPAIINLAISAAVFGVIYLSALHFLNAIPDAEKQRLVNFVQNFLQKFRKVNDSKETVSVEV